MNLTVHPHGPLSGASTVPGDKSIAHRAVLLGAVAEGESRIDNFPFAGVTRATLRVLTGLGVEWEASASTLRIVGNGRSDLTTPIQPLECGNSATTMRLTTGLLSGANVPAVLDGSNGLRRRPMGPLVQALRELEVPVHATDGGHAPLTLAARSNGRALRGGIVQLDAPSAQLKSAVLLAGLGASAPVTVIEPAPSRDHTERMLRSMGVEITSEAPERVTLTPPSSPLRPLRLALPGDFSSAAFLITVAIILPGSSITVLDVGLNPGRTGLLEVLSAMGARIAVQPTGERGGERIGRISVAHAPLRGARVSGALVPRMIDEFPALAVAAVCAHGETRVRQAESLRSKESDRIAALVNELRALGANIEEHPDGFTIHGPTPLRGGVVQCHGDHRLAMALAIAGLAAADPVTIAGAEAIDESFPGFSETLHSLGAQLE